MWVRSLGGEDPWGAWQPTPVFSLGESHDQRSLAGYSPRGCKELSVTEATGHAHMHMIKAVFFSKAYDHKLFHEYVLYGF